MKKITCWPTAVNVKLFCHFVNYFSFTWMIPGCSLVYKVLLCSSLSEHIKKNCKCAVIKLKPNSSLCLLNFTVTFFCSVKAQVTFLEHTSLSSDIVHPAAALGVSLHWWMTLFPLPAVTHVVFRSERVIKRDDVGRNTKIRTLFPVISIQTLNCCNNSPLHFS